MQSCKSALLSLSLCVLLASTGTVQAGVIAHWTFDGSPGASPAGAGSVPDSSPNGLNGTPEGTPTYEATPTGVGLRFDGAGGRDGVFLNDNNLLFSRNSLTVEAIVALDVLLAQASNELRQIVFRGDSQAGNDPFYLAVLGNRIRWLVEGPSGVSAAAVDVVIPFAIGEFFHIAGTIDDSTGDMKLFFNGALVGSTNTAIRPTFGPLNNARVSLGYLFDGSSRAQWFDGVIDEIRISDQALSPTQFLNARTVPAPGSLVLCVLAIPVMLQRMRNSRRSA